MKNVIALPIPNEIKIVVPNDFSLMSPYILFEQQDWFEDEIKFLRDIIRPGRNIIDIGANYGTYTLTLASKIRPDGKLWAFEPTAATAACLRESIAVNHADNIELIQAGVSNHPGEATFYTQKNGELNSLTPEPGMQTETIRLTTLDAEMEKNNWPEIDFIKLDAEGEEIRIIEGARRTLAKNNPLIMFELTNPTGINHELIGAFQNVGYQPYRLIPGTGFLIPFDSSAEPDDYLLNLFCCNETKAASLEAEDLLTRRTLTSGQLPPTGYLRVVEIFTEIAAGKASRRERSLKLAKLAAQAATAIENKSTGLEELSACARILLEFGERKKAIQAALLVTHKIEAGCRIDPTLPLIPLSPGLADMRPSENIDTWLYCSAFDLIIQTRAYSSFYTGKDDLQLIDVIEHNGYMTEALVRRKFLIKKRFALP